MECESCNKFSNNIKLNPYRTMSRISSWFTCNFSAHCIFNNMIIVLLKSHPITNLPPPATPSSSWSRTVAMQSPTHRNPHRRLWNRTQSLCSGLFYSAKKKKTRISVIDSNVPSSKTAYLHPAAGILQVALGPDKHLEQPHEQHVLRSTAECRQCGPDGGHHRTRAGRHPADV